MHKFSHSHSSFQATSPYYGQKATEDGIVIELPKNCSPVSQKACFCPGSLRKYSGLSGKSTRGCSPKIEDKRSKLNSKSPLFDQVLEKPEEDSPPLSNQPSWCQPLPCTKEEVNLHLNCKPHSSECLEASLDFDCLSDGVNNDFEIKYKTEMCRNFQFTGNCRFGPKCSYAHGEAELRNKKHINLHYKSKRCNQFFEQGYCPYGNRCQYLHIENSYTHIFNAYCEKILVWMDRNPTMEIGNIMRKTHPVVKRLSIFEKLDSCSSK